MTHALTDRAFVVWTVLIVATAATAWLGTDHGLDDVRLQTSVVLAIAVVKVRLVGLYFMGIKEAPVQLRTIFDTWCACLLVGTVGIYLVA